MFSASGEITDQYLLLFNVDQFRTDDIPSYVFIRGRCVLSQGSVLVTFDLWFSQLTDVKEVELQLKAGLQDSMGLVVDQDSIRITGEVRGHGEVAGEIRQSLNESVCRKTSGGGDANADAAGDHVHGASRWERSVGPRRLSCSQSLLFRLWVQSPVLLTSLHVPIRPHASTSNISATASSTAPTALMRMLLAVVSRHVTPTSDCCVYFLSCVFYLGRLHVRLWRLSS